MPSYVTLNKGIREMSLLLNEEANITTNVVKELGPGFLIKIKCCLQKARQTRKQESQQSFHLNKEIQ